MLSGPNVFMRPREATKAADEAKARFAHIDGVQSSLWQIERRLKAVSLETLEVLEARACSFLFPRMCWFCILRLLVP